MISPGSEHRKHPPIPAGPPHGASRLGDAPPPDTSRLRIFHAMAVRLDRWLWAARFYKTRSLAAQAIDGGKVRVNGARVKRAKGIVSGDEVRITKPPFEYTVVVQQESEHRRSAEAAHALYLETEASLAARERLRLQLRLQPSVTYDGKGRPTKRDRRAIQRLKRHR